MDCPVCLCDMQNSVNAASIMKCGHSMHVECLNEYTKTNVAGPICKKSIIDISQLELYMDREI